MSKQTQLPNKSLPEIESEVTQFWKENKIFEKVTKLRENAPKYRFVDGPPFPNDVPHYGHMLCSVAKDVIPRYQTMKGKSVRRVFGWDCHGLAVEEKLNSKLGIKGEESKSKIEQEIGIKNYIQMCRDFVGTNIDAWRWYMDKLGRWSDMDNAYKTMDPKFGESVIWAFKQLWDKGLVYKGKRTSLYSTDSGTPVSEFEVNMDPDNYREIEDVSVYMKFKVKYHKTGQGVGIVIFNEKGEILMAERNEEGRERSIGIIGGKKDLEDKDVYQTAKRESMEEIGIIPEKLELAGDTVDIFEGRMFHTYHFKAFLDSRSELKVNDAFTNMRWVDPKDIEWDKLHIPTKNCLLDVLGEKKYSNIQADLPNVYLLAWTTTPWTLYANFALAVNQEEDYLLVKYDDTKEEYLVFAEKLFDQLKEALSKEFVNPQVVDKFKGKELLDLSYEQYLTDINSNSHEVVAQNKTEGLTSSPADSLLKGGINTNDFKIYHGDFVSMEDGTGVVHIAPAYGAEDFELGKQCGLSDFGSIDDTGHMLVGSFQGEYLREANLKIAKELLQNGKVLKIKNYKHRVPFYRGNNPLIYKTQDAWFVNIQKLKPRMLELIDKTKWVPDSIRDGRWKNTIETSPDWCLSRDRYWNTIMPIWINTKDEKDIWVIGSVQEMMENSKNQIYKKDDKYYLSSNDKEVTMHRDVCDDIILYRNDSEYRRISQVLDNWMDAGSVPFAEYHYPFENDEVFRSKPSADFIVEYVGQVRAWFNVLYRMSIGVFDDIAFDNVICTGTLAGNDGRKMSKSYGNYPDSTKVLNEVGGEAVRLFLMNSPLLLGGDAECKEEVIKDQVKIILLPLLNSLKYFVLYAEDFKYDENFVSDNFSDKWILAKLSQLVSNTDTNLSNYNIPNVAKDLQDFVGELSSWYIKTNRDRFVSKDNSALQTLYKVLLNLTFSMSPMIPFVTEYAWQVLKDYQEKLDFESVHMVEWKDIQTPSPREARGASQGKQYQDIFVEMEEVRMIISAGLKIRDENKIPVKQVLAKVSANRELNIEQVELIKQELNVLDLVSNKSEEELKVELDLNITKELRLLGLVREVTSTLQAERKVLGLSLEDKIEVNYSGSELVLECIQNNQAEIGAKVKCEKFSKVESNDSLKVKKLGGEELKFVVRRDKI